MTQKRNETGFTIVELLIVIVVIGILAMLVITTFSGINQRARNTERQTDIKSIHGQLETYHAVHGTYPTLANMNDAAWRDGNMKGLDDEALIAPNGASATLVDSATPGVNEYAYVVRNASDLACDNTAGNDCVKYTLSSTYEGGGGFSKDSLN